MSLLEGDTDEYSFETVNIQLPLVLSRRGWAKVQKGATQKIKADYSKVMKRASAQIFNASQPLSILQLIRWSL